MVGGDGPKCRCATYFNYLTTHAKRKNKKGTSSGASRTQSYPVRLFAFWALSEIGGVRGGFARGQGAVEYL